MTTTAQAPGARAELQRRWDEADTAARAAKRELGAARRRAQEARRIQTLLEAEARRLGLELVITHGHSQEA